MKDFADLTYRGQVRRMRSLAEAALEAFPLTAPDLRFVAHGENTTFRVRESSAGNAEYLLRIHRPARHGRFVDSNAAILSELRWLEALDRDTDLSVPKPVVTRDGLLTVAVESGGVPGPRTCSLLVWMDGANRSASARSRHFELLGGAMARLHNHTATWGPPPGFVRIRWDAETFFGNTMEYGGLAARDVWNLLPATLRVSFDRVAVHVSGVMDALGTGPEVFGLIHADLHLDNVLFAGSDVRIIDFDDSGMGYHLYDIAVALWEQRHRPDFPERRDAFLNGYRAHREIRPGLLVHLDSFIAAREVAFGLWYRGMAEVNPGFRGDLDDELGIVAKSLDEVLVLAPF